jgi:hypothetical protein
MSTAVPATIENIPSLFTSYYSTPSYIKIEVSLVQMSYSYVI